MRARLILITDRRRSPTPLPNAVAAALTSVPPGSTAILLREKDLVGGELLRLARTLRDVTRRFGAPLIVSGRWDIALAVEADGVHLGGEAPPFEAARRIARGLEIGVSLHDDEQAPPEASYALISPIFATTSKPGATPLGLDGLRRAVNASANVPMFALGGITGPDEVSVCLENGAFGVAALGAVLTSADPGGRAQALCGVLSRTHFAHDLRVTSS